MEFKVYGWVLTFMPAARLQEIQAGGSNLHPCPPKQDNQGAQCERMQHRTDHVFLLWYLKQMREEAKDEGCVLPSTCRALDTMNHSRSLHSRATMLTFFHL